MKITRIFSINEPENVSQAAKLTKLISKEIFAFAEKQGFFNEDGAEFPEFVTKEEQEAGCALWMLGDILKEIGGRYFFAERKE